MLDAGRTLQGREEDQKKERESMTATDDSITNPAKIVRILNSPSKEF